MLSWSWYHTCLNCSEAIPSIPNRSCMFRPILLTFLCGFLAAQQQLPQQPQQPDPDQATTIFRGGTEQVQAPVLVFDRSGNYVDGLQPYQFHLFDNGKEQNINVDVTYQPISLVICLQANAHVDSILPQVKKIGGLIPPLLIGDQGEAPPAAPKQARRLPPDVVDAVDAAGAVDAAALGAPSPPRSSPQTRSTPPSSAIPICGCATPPPIRRRRSPPTASRTSATPPTTPVGPLAFGPSSCGRPIPSASPPSSRISAAWAKCTWWKPRWGAPRSRRGSTRCPATRWSPPSSASPPISIDRKSTR